MEKAKMEAQMRHTGKKLRRLVHQKEHEELWRRLQRLERVIEALAFHEEIVREGRSRRQVASDALSEFLER